MPRFVLTISFAPGGLAAIPGIVYESQAVEAKLRTASRENFGPSPLAIVWASALEVQQDGDDSHRFLRITPITSAE
jgi:hypothetical protein